ncbi:MAG: hypothetical protein ACI9R3_006044 [Verrucomicrobiales bacterium]|jgi:hypothetical protein
MRLCMRTTLQLEEGLFREAKEQAAREGKPLKQLLEEGLRLVLKQRRERASSDGNPLILPVSTCSGGTQAGVDLSDNSALEDILSSH